jgi:formylglycine-generating enzyme required for sulfatase activity
VWELVDDFNTALVTGESRGDSQLDDSLFCGAGAASSVDPSDYAAFMRYALRTSYQAHYTMTSMGFRCANDIQQQGENIQPGGENHNENS